MTIAATKVFAGLKLEKATIASSKAKMRLLHPSSNFDFSSMSDFDENPCVKI